MLPCLSCVTRKIQHTSRKSTDKLERRINKQSEEEEDEWKYGCENVYARTRSFENVWVCTCVHTCVRMCLFLFGAKRECQCFRFVRLRTFQRPVDPLEQVRAFV